MEEAMKTNLIGTLIISSSNNASAHEMPRLIFEIASILLNTKRKVTVLSKNIYPQYMLPEDVCYVAGDFSQEYVIKPLLDNHREVIHLAYETSTNNHFGKLLPELINNLDPLIQLFHNVVISGAKLVLVSAGSAVYGEAKELEIKETHSTKPVSIYGTTKLTLENYATLFGSTLGMRFVCVRPSNIYGVGQLPFCGQGFVATALAQAIKGQSIKIFGRGEAIRDYIYVNDLASGVVHALIYGRLSETYNISSGIGLSNLDVIQVLQSFTTEIGCEIQVEFMPERKFDLKRNVLNSNKLAKDTGWTPGVQFDEGIRYTLEWLRNSYKDES